MLAISPATSTSYHIKSSSQILNFASSHAKALGIVQIILGILSIVFFIPSIVFLFGFYMLGFGIWCGIFYIIAGGLTVGAAENKNKCMIVASLTMCILATLAAVVQVCLGVCSGVWALAEGEWYDDDFGVSFAGRVAINTVVAFFGLVAMVVCIIASTLSCKVLCRAGQMPAEAPVQVITLEDGRVVNAIVLPTQDFFQTRKSYA